VHDGDASGGHYFTFIKDHHKDIWWKLNDTIIRKADYGDVELFSQGGHSQMTAYMAIYISSEELALAKANDLYTKHNKFVNLISTEVNE